MDNYELPATAYTCIFDLLQDAIESDGFGRGGQFREKR